MPRAPQKEFQRNLSFAYTVETLDGKRTVGCWCAPSCSAELGATCGAGLLAPRAPRLTPSRAAAT